MAEIALNSEQLREEIKKAIVELLQDNKEEVYELLVKIVEDVTMERAIAEGETSDFVDRETIFNILEAER